jgi:hypothetical protein
MPNTTSALEAFGAKIHEKRQIRELTAQLFGNVQDDAPGPCVECHNAQRCACGLACEQFVLFARFGGNQRWRVAAMQPSAEIFARIFTVEKQPAAGLKQEGNFSDTWGRARRRSEALGL